MPPHPTPWKSILLLSYHLRLGLPSGFPTKPLYAPLLCPTRATYPVHPILLDLITRTLLGEEYRSVSSSLCSFFSTPVVFCETVTEHLNVCICNFQFTIMNSLLFTTLPLYFPPFSLPLHFPLSPFPYIFHLSPFPTCSPLSPFPTFPLFLPSPTFSPLSPFPYFPPLSPFPHISRSFSLPLYFPFFLPSHSSINTSS